MNSQNLYATANQIFIIVRYSECRFVCKRVIYKYQIKISSLATQFVGMGQTKETL